jgi:protein-tyrosine phosphatase
MLSRAKGDALIDLHCHLLPGVDDGPATLDESIAMARAAYDDGVRAIAATPHDSSWQARFKGVDARQVLQAQVAALQEALRQTGIDLALYPGM